VCEGGSVCNVCESVRGVCVVVCLCDLCVFFCFWVLCV
jgi:hypothetical protein